MILMRTYRSGLVFGFLILAAVVFSSSTGYAESSDGNASGGQGEDSNYVNIEEAMREYQARYMYFKATDHNSNGDIDPDELSRAAYVKWPDCIDINTTLDATKPEDGTYKCIMQDRHQAAVIVAAMVDQFFADYNGTDPLYTEFIQLDGEASFNAANFYTESDFPLTWVSGSPTYSGIAPSGNAGNHGVTAENYKEAAIAITSYVKLLQVTGSGSAVATVTGNVDGDTDVKQRRGSDTAYKPGESISDAFTKALTDWASDSWTAYPGISLQIGARSGLDASGSPVNTATAVYTANRGRIKVTGTTGQHDYVLYLRVIEEGYGFATTLSNQPVEGRSSAQTLVFKEYMRFRGGGTHYTPVLAGEDPEWTGDTDLAWDSPELVPGPTTGEIWYSAWEINEMYVAEIPQFDSSPDRGCEDCGCVGSCPNNQQTTYETGSLKVTTGLGMLESDRKAGRLMIHVQEPSTALFTPKMLQAVLPDHSSIEAIYATDSSIRQVKTSDLLADIEVVTADEEYTISFYHVDASDESVDQVQASKVGGLWVPEVGEVPYRVIVVSRPEANNNNIRFTEKDENGSVTLVNQFVWDDTDTWDLYEGLDKTTPVLPGALRRTSKKISVDGDTRTETRKVKEAGGTVLIEAETIYTQYPFGWAMTESSVDPTGADLKQVWTYYTTPGSDGYGKVRSYTSETGYWEYYVYDSDGALSKTIRQLGDNQIDLDDASGMESDNVVIQINEYSGSKTIDGSAEDLLVIKTTTKAEGTVEQVSYVVYRGTSEVDSGNLDEVWTLRCADADPENGHADTLTFIAAYMNDLLADGDIDDADDAKHLLSRSWKYKAGFVYDAMADAAHDADAEPFDMKRSLGPDGQVTLYDYTTVNTSVVERGYADNPLAASPAIGYGTRTTRVVDDQGNPVSTLSEKVSESDNGGDWFIVSLMKTGAADDFGRPTRTDYFFGEDAAEEVASSGTGTAAYNTQIDYGTNCCGGDDTVTRTDRAGIASKTYPDDLGRTEKSVQAFGTSGEIETLVIYDAAGRVTTRGINSNPSTDDDLDDPADIKTVTAYDDAGRVKSVTDPEGRKSYMTYRRVKPDGNAFVVGTDTGVFYWETRSYGNDADYPVSVTWADSHGNTVLSYTGSCASFTGTGGVPSGTETLTEHSRSTSVYDWDNRVTEGRAYFNIASLAKNATGTAGTNYLVTGTTEYDALGRAYQRTDAAGNITETVYEDGTGRAIITQIGVDEDGDGDFESSEKHAVSRVFYKKFVSGNPTGDDRPWPTRVYTVKPNLASAPNDSDLLDSSPTLTDYVYTETVETHTVDATDDYLTASDRWSRPQYGPWSRQSSDEQGRPVVSDTTQNGDTTHLLTRSISAYWDTGDERDGKLRYTHQIEIDTSTNTATTKKIATNYSYDDAGRQVKAETTGRGFTKTAYDVFGRTERTVFASSEGTNTSVYGANAFTDDIVLTESVPTYDKSGLVTGTVTYSRAHDAPASTTGLLSAASADQRRATYSYTWYDDNGRQTHSGTVGTDGSYTYNASSPPQPNTSDDRLISKVEYDDAGRAYLRTDNLGRKARVYFDDLGRTTHTVENYDAAKLTGSDPDTPASRDADVNRITKTIYDNSATGGGARIETVAIDPDSNGNTSDNQSTLYIHSGEVNASERGPIRVNGRPIATLMPDAIEDGTDRADVVTEINAGGTVFGDFSFLEYYANGQVRRNTDARGVQILTTYTNEGWLSLRQVYTATGSTWTPVGDLAMLWYYGDAGEVSNAFTYSDAAGNNQTSQIDYVYDGYYNVIEEKQDHDPGASPSIKQTITYAFDKTLSTNTYSKAYRLDKITYPNGRVIQLNYDGHAGIDDAIGRANAIEEDSSGGDIVSYQYLGSGRMVRKDYATPKVRLDMVDETGEGSDANNDYEVSLDKFGRPLRYQWETYDGSGDADKDLVHIAHAYDRNSNRLYDERKVATAYSKVFGRDDLDRINNRDTGLIKFTGSTASIDSHWKLDSKTWNYDQLGNPATVDTAFDTSDRYGVTTNKANEVTKLHNDGTKNPNEFNKPFSVSTEDEVFTDQLNAANGNDLSSDVSVTGGFLVVNSATVDAANPIVLLADPKLGALSFVTRIKVADLPDGVTAGEERGLVGYVFGYKSATDFWVYGKNMASSGTSSDGDFELYHMHDADSSGSIDFSDTAERELISSTAQVTPSAATLYTLVGYTAYNSITNRLAAGSLSGEGGVPSGRVGLYSETDGTSFDSFNQSPVSPAYRLGANWQARGRNRVIDDPHDSGATDSGVLEVTGAFHRQDLPVLLRNVKASRFEVTFRMTRRSTDSQVMVDFVFGYNGQGDHERLRLNHKADVTSDSSAIVGFDHGNGDTRSSPTATLTESKLTNATNPSDDIWYRITSDGVTVKAYSASTESGLATKVTNNDEGYSSANFDFDGGQIGFAGGNYTAYIDNITVKTNTDGNGSYETTEIVEAFDLDSLDHIEDTLEHDAAGNLTFDGSKRYTYDAHNRCVKVENAYRDSSDVVQAGSLLAEWRYDARHRRIVEETYTADGAENTAHRYCIGGSLVETRNGSDQVTQQHIWDNLTGGYIDSLAQVSNNADPGVDDDPGTSGVQDLCEDHFYALQDVQFKVLAIVDYTGEVVERYEYTLYGQRTVMNGQSAPLSSTAYKMTIGFQGLRHDAATSSIDNRARLYLPTLHRFAQRDPLGYPDGMNSYAAYHVMWGGVDPTGQITWKDVKQLGRDTQRLNPLTNPFFIIDNPVADRLFPETSRTVKKVKNASPVPLTQSHAGEQFADTVTNTVEHAAKNPGSTFNPKNIATAGIELEIESIEMSVPSLWILRRCTGVGMPSDKMNPVDDVSVDIWKNAYTAAIFARMGRAKGNQSTNNAANPMGPAHNASNYERLKAQLRLEETLGSRPISVIDDIAARNTRVAVYDVDSGKLLVGKATDVLHVDALSSHGVAWNRLSTHTLEHKFVGGFLRVDQSGRLTWTSHSGTFPYSPNRHPLNFGDILRGRGVEPDSAVGAN